MYSDHEMALLLYSRHAIIVLSFLDIRQHLSSFQIQIVEQTYTECFNAYNIYNMHVYNK